MACPTSFNCDYPYTYDVFLSFRGVDNRKSFTRDLYNSLRQKGIKTFIDEELKIGEEIMAGLGQAIRKSRMFIVVFSENYASSTHCLNELVMILECLEEREKGLFWPVFYDVEPSQLRYQNGSYGEALAKHEERFQNKDMVLKWRQALSKAANIFGWPFQHGTQSESEFITKIVKEVSKRINRRLLCAADKPVGLESPVLEVISLLGLGSENGVIMVGIYGVGGIGKSTIACAVYNLIAFQFEGHCFLANIREKSANHDLVQLQQTLLTDILGEEDIKVRNVNRGIQMIKERLRTKKVLLILDDVEEERSLEVLAGGYDWFGPGSRVIITTRDKHLLDNLNVLKSYQVEQLNDEKALELFSWHAFKSNKIDPSYADVSKQAISYAHGLPLALKVIGSHLYGKSLDVWKSSLGKYEKAPLAKIYGILKISYDNLEEDEKGIFLDMACFWNSYQISLVKDMLDIRGFHAENGIEVLTDKSLITIDDNGRLRMHDLIQDMGREIVRREKSKPGKRSRLWFNQDIIDVLEDNKGTDAIEVIVLDLSKDKEVQWSGEAFKQMKNLKILIIRNGRFSRGPKYLPNSLRVLHWSGYPSPSLPSNFNPKNLVKLSLPESCLKSFKSFRSLKVFESLSLLNFEGSKFLTELPSLSGVPNMTTLCLDNCTNLLRIHNSVGFLNKLKLLSAQGCTQLKNLVPSIFLASLETLDLSGCSSLKRFPEVLGKMENIRKVYLDHTNIDELPFSIGNFIGLEQLFLRGCKRLNQFPSTIHILPKLEIVTAYGCGCKGFRASLYKLLRKKRGRNSSSYELSKQCGSKCKKVKITPTGP